MESSGVRKVGCGVQKNIGGLKKYATGWKKLGPPLPSPLEEARRRKGGGENKKRGEGRGSCLGPDKKRERGGGFLFGAGQERGGVLVQGQTRKEGGTTTVFCEAWTGAG